MSDRRWKQLNEAAAGLMLLLIAALCLSTALWCIVEVVRLAVH